MRCRSSHRKSASLKSPRNCLKKKAANDLLQWPTSPKWHIFAHLLDCSTVPPCADWGSAVIGLSPREAETWNSLAHALTEFRIGKRILVDDLRSYRRRRSKNWRHHEHPLRCTHPVIKAKNKVSRTTLCQFSQSFAVFLPPNRTTFLCKPTKTRQMHKQLKETRLYLGLVLTR